MKLRVIIYTTASTDWFHADFPALKSMLERAKGVTVDDLDIKRVKLDDIPTRQDADGDWKPDWQWFEDRFTTPAKARGYNAVVLHISRDEKRKFGITKNGSYRKDHDDIFECWFSASKGQRADNYRMSEFSRLFIHELGGHGFERFVIGYDTELTHTYDYELKQLPGLISTFDFTRWNALFERRNALQRLFDKLKSYMPTTFLAICRKHLGTDASPKDRARDELGCAETVSTLLNQFDPAFPIVTGTWTLWKELQKHCKQVYMPAPGVVIISPTGEGNGSIPGHTGVFDDQNRIMSNDSKTGKFLQNYTLATWYARYGRKGGFPVYYFKPL